MCRRASLDSKEPDGTGNKPRGHYLTGGQERGSAVLKFDEVKEAVSLREFCEDQLEARGGGFFVCPKCGSGNGPNHTAAFKVTGNRWKCFACDESGDVFDLAGILNDTTDRREQMQAVAAWAGIADGEPVRRRRHAPQAADYTEGRAREARYIEEARGHIQDREAVAYLSSRGITEEEGAALGIGYDPKGKRLVIPWAGSDYYHIDRDTTGAASHKYEKPRSLDVGAQPLYNPSALKEPVFFIVEGALDAIAVSLCGFQAVALGGTGARGAVDAMKARNPKGVAVVMLDADERGQEATEALCGLLDGAGLQHVTARTKTKDAAEWFETDRDGLRAFLTGVYDNALASAREEREKAYNAAMSSLRAQNPAEVAAALYMLDDTVEPIPTGFASLDEVLGGGLQTGLYVLGAVSSLGKTTLAVQIADHVAASGNPVLFVTIEQSAREIVAKSLSRMASECGQDFSTTDVMSAQRRKSWGEGTYARIMAVCERYTSEVAPNLRILEGTKQPAVADVAAVALEMQGHYGKPPVVFVDYLQLLAAQDERDTDKRAVDRNVMSLRQLARDLQTPVFVISSLNRSSYSTGVTLESFKESGSVEYGSDVLLGLQPEGMREHMEQTKDTRTKTEADRFLRESKAEKVRACEIVILKNRAGRTPYDGLPLKFRPVASTFKEDRRGTASNNYAGLNIV